MGRKVNSGLTTGVNGQYNIENYELDARLKEQIEETVNDNSPLNDDGISLEELKILDDAKVKYTKEDVVFVSRDSSGQLIWLEIGNDRSGLTHILARHSNDFADKHNISRNNIKSHINSFIKNGKLEYFKVTQRNGRDCYERLYSKSGQYFLLTGVGLNGYLVSAYPLSEKEAKALIRRNKK